LAGLAYSPAKHIPLDSRAELIPIGRHRFSAVQCCTPPFYLSRPSLVDAFAISLVKTLKKTRSNLGAVVFGKAQNLLKQTSGGIGHVE
jgi:hypothetical protein